MNTPTDAEAALHFTNEKANFHRLTTLLMCGGASLLREKLDSFHSPTDLPLRLGDPIIGNQLRRARLSKPDWDCLYPSPDTFGKSADFSMTLTFRLLRTICHLTPPPTGWDSLPNSADHSLEADIVRIKYYRNNIYGHNHRMEITNSEFVYLWNEISEALLRIAGSINNEKRDEWKKAIDGFLHDHLTTEEQRHADELQLWYKKDMDVKDAAIEVIDEPQQLNQRLDLPGQMFVNLQEMQRDVSKVSSNTDLLAELEKIASDKGFVISDNEGSGNCMFYALSEQLNLVKGVKISHGELRQSIVQYLRRNPKLTDGTDLFNFIHGYQSWADYLSNMEKAGTWGDHVILYGTANCYKTCIDVISSQSNHSDLTIRPDGDVMNTNPLVLGHVHEVHYVSLLPKRGLQSKSH